MNQEDFTNAYILLLSGAAEMKDKGVKWKDEYDRDVYIEFPDFTPTRAIVRGYWDNGNEHYKCEWTKGFKHGKELYWEKNGKLNYECNWMGGIKHGKELWWYKNGKLYCECNWIKGLRRGKELHWHKNGKLYREMDFG